MKRKLVLALLCGMAAITMVVAISNALKRVEEESVGKDGISNQPAGKQNNNYVTYEADFDDGYLMYFDFLPGLQEFGTMVSGVVTDDFGQGTTMLTCCHVPSKLNIDQALPHTAEEYINAEIDAEFCDALPYENGEVHGYSYWERHEYSYGTGYTHGYNVFLGDEYFYIFVHRNDGWPQNIENVRIVKK